MKYGRYEVIEELGRGQMGVVYLAHDPKIDRKIALKVLRQDRLASEDFIVRFMKEAKAVGRLSHPGIVTVYDIGQDQETVFIAMELLEGVSMEEWMSAGAPQMADIVDIAVQIAEALDYAHRRGIVHRDIKPTNIIVTLDGKVKLTDFGIARIEDASATYQTQAGEILGTPSYMSAEQVMGKTIDGRSDLYSLGVILYQLCTGTRPFKGANLSAVFMAITQETPPAPHELNPSLSPAMSRLILRSLSKTPEERFANGNEMAAALKACLQDGDIGSAPQAPADDKTHVLPRPVTPPRKRRLGPLIAGVCLLALLVAGGAYWARSYFSDTQTPSKPSPTSVEPDRPVAEETATIRIESTPPGALVYVDGELKGQSPATLNLALGKYEFRLRLSGYYDWEAQLNFDQAGDIALPVELISKETEEVQ